MSLGLGDLNKKKSRASTPNLKSNSSGATVAGTPKVKSGWVKSKTARPWSDSGLTRAPQRRKQTDAEAVMNEDWLSLHVEPVLQTPFIQETTFSHLALKLMELEERLQDQIESSLESLCGIKKRV